MQFALPDQIPWITLIFRRINKNLSTSRPTLLDNFLFNDAVDI